jgi:hypothetical protein
MASQRATVRSPEPEPGAMPSVRPGVRDVRAVPTVAYSVFVFDVLLVVPVLLVPVVESEPDEEVLLSLDAESGGEEDDEEPFERASGEIFFG